MTYQEIYLAHVAGNPPLAWPQTSVETFEQYKLRMNSLGLQPDITRSVDGDFEADADYEARLATYSYPQDAAAPTAGVAKTAISASYATVAQTEIDPEATASFALLAKTASFVASASHALVADSAGGVMTNAQTASYLEGVRAQLTSAGVDALTITATTGTGIDVRTSTSGRGIYAQALLTQALLATQAGVPAGPMNTPVVQVQRSIANLNGQTATSAVFDVTDQYALGTGPLITANNIGTEVFKVDLTGSLYSSGSKGYTGVVSFHDGDTNAVSMSFQGGLFVGLV